MRFYFKVYNVLLFFVTEPEVKKPAAKKGKSTKAAVKPAAPKAVSGT